MTRKSVEESRSAPASEVENQDAVARVAVTGSARETLLAAGLPESAVDSMLATATAVGEAMGEIEDDDMRLYLLLALFDRRDGTYTADLVQAAREGYERADMGEEGAWDRFDALWNQSDSSGRLDAVRRDYSAARGASDEGNSVHDARASSAAPPNPNSTTETSNP